MKKFAILAATVSLAALTSTPASAATLIFTLTGPQSITFSLDSPSTPNTSSTGFFNQVGFNAVPITINGTAQTASSIRFSNFTNGTGNFAINGTSLGPASFGSPQLFQRIAGGQVTFSQGTFNTPRLAGGPASFQLNIAPAGLGAVPEPATWAMMILGFAVVGAGLRWSVGQRTKLSYS